MASLTIRPVVSGLARTKLLDVSSDSSDKRRVSLTHTLDVSLAEVEVRLPQEQDASSESSLPNLTLADVLEHQGVVLLTSDESTTEEATLIVAVDVTDSPEGAVESTLVSSADIEALYTNASLDMPGSHFQTSAQTSAQTPGSNILLLKSGWAYLALIRSPLELPTEPHPDAASENWSPWRKTEGGLHEIQDLASGLWSRLVGTLVDTSPKSPEEASGAYGSTQVSSSIGGASTTWHNLELSPEGLFSVSNSTLVSGGHLNPDNSYILQVTNSVAERSSTFSGTASSEGGSSASVGVQNEQLTEHVGDLFGSWEILEDGVTLEMRFADGRVERRLFLKAQESGGLSIDGNTWWRNSDAAPDLLRRLFEILTDPENARGGASWASILAKVELQLNRNRATREADPTDAVTPGSVSG